MSRLQQVSNTFPAVRIPSRSGGADVEVNLIAQLSIGEGTRMVRSVADRQREHTGYIDELDEPSTKLGGVNIQHNDASSLYSFVVDSGGHPFHRHAGPRIFTAVSGSAGTELRFATASPSQIAEDPFNFVRSLRIVTIPPDCLFTVRFGGGTWHQFLARGNGRKHPALFALSCHTNELSGDLDEVLHKKILEDLATIPGLTEVLPASVVQLLTEEMLANTPTTALSLNEAPNSFLSRFCALTRNVVGRWRLDWRKAGFLTHVITQRAVVTSTQLPANSRLHREFAGGFNYQDCFSLELAAHEYESTSNAEEWLARLLTGFVDNPSPGVTRLMMLRNLLVKPLRLRTSPLGCPVSSLLSQESADRFRNFPVLGQHHEGAHFSEVILGADDRHLQSGRLWPLKG